MHQQFHRIAPNELWVKGITEHLTRKKLYCGAVVDMFSRKAAGPSIDNCQGLTLVLSALECGDQESETASPGDCARRSWCSVHVLRIH